MGILLSAVLTALIAIISIMYVDRFKPEPIKQLAWAVFAGMLSIIPAIGLEIVAEFFNGNTVLGIAISASVIEEACKLAALMYIVKKFNCIDEHIDGIVYAICVGVGFAFIENLEYFTVYRESINYRVLTPGHVFFAIPMGYYLSKAKYSSGADKKNYLALMFLTPALFHWAWDFPLLISTKSNNELVTIVCLILFGCLLFQLVRWSKKYITEQFINDKVDRTKDDEKRIKQIRKEAVKEYLAELGWSVENLEAFAKAKKEYEKTVRKHELERIEHYDAFISYSHENATEALETYDALTKKGYKVWIDKDKFRHGDEFFDIIYKALDNSSLVFFFSSEHSNKSENVLKEITHALDNDIPIVPIRLDSCHYAWKIHDSLNGKYYAEFEWTSEFINGLANDIHDHTQHSDDSDYSTDNDFEYEEYGE
ncbi:MAG: PrsW family glutamic-type intramembrane protease [Bacteroidales bacterium]|nr:PrsW family glutamic-type intramembrane protease [Bacteroidales bacterium]